jgi:hypothetical protein
LFGCIFASRRRVTVLISNDIGEILNDYEFTDSIITNLKWEDNLLEAVSKLHEQKI